jgi:hypothetical protein
MPVVVVAGRRVGGAMGVIWNVSVVAQARTITFWERGAYRSVLGFGAAAQLPDGTKPSFQGIRISNHPVVAGI